MSAASGSSPAQQGATSSDVELAKIALEAETRRHRYQIWQRVVEGVRTASWIVAAWVPLQAVRGMAGDLAGKSTTLDANVNVAITVSVFLSVGWAVSVVKSHSRKKKILHLRKRTDELERLLEVRKVARGEVAQ
jgi:hypothetical protein